MKKYNIGDKIEFIYNNNKLLTGTILRIDGIFENKIKVKAVTTFFKTDVVTIRRKDIIEILKEIPCNHEIME
jgi:hypothetical protein